MVETTSPRPHAAWTPRIAVPRTMPRIVVTTEQLAYGAIFIAAVLTRFWSLGTRALHHDESLHAWFSYQYAIGKGYFHDPLMHGPFLFHTGAAMFALFGASDASARYGTALFGVILVMLPWLLRPLIGRWGALVTSVLLLVSPSILYYSRLVRHDIYLMTFTFLIIIAIGRYVQTPQARWVYVGMLALALAHTNHEASYLIALLFGAFLFLIVTWRAAKELLAATFGYLFVLAATVAVVPKVLHLPSLPEIPWDASKGEVSWASWQPYLRTLLGSPLVLLVLAWTAIYIMVAVYILSTLRLRETPEGTTPNDRLFGGWTAGGVVDAFHRLIEDRRTLLGALGAATVVWTLLYTSFFTNIGGIFSGGGYSLIYWLGQHDVHRGGQPFYYYAFMWPLSGPLSFLFGIAAGGVTLSRFIGYARGLRPMTTRLFMQVMLLWYGAGIFAVLTWAGEKMPWLITHVVLPFTILSASLIGEAIEYLAAHWREKVDFATLPPLMGRPAGALGIVANPPQVRGSVALRFDRRTLDCSVIAGAALLIAGWFFALNRITDNPAADIRFLLVAMPIVVVAFFALYALQVGVKRSLSAAALAFALPLVLFELHLGWNLAFFGGDVPTDMLVYTQTAPDMPRMMEELDELSRQTTGRDSGLVVMDSSSTIWPMNWYLREYITANNVRTFGGQPAGQSQMVAPPPSDVAVVMVGNDDMGAWEEQYLTNFQRTDYVMRWWFPEEYYRNFTYSPDAPRPDYPGLWKVDPATGKEVRATWGDTATKAVSSVRALGGKAESVQLATISANGEMGTPEVHVTPAPTTTLWRYFALREPPLTVGSFNFHLYVRNDLVPTFNEIRYA